MTTDRNDFADHTFSTLPPGYRGWALPCKDDPAAVWVWLSPEEMTGLTPEEAAHKAEFTLGDDRIFMAQHRACKDAWKHYEAAKPRAPAGSIATRLRAAADDLTFSGRPDPHDDKALLREAAAVLDSPDLRLLKDANAEWQEFGQWLVTTFQPGAVEPAAVLCPGGEYESGAAFCRRVLQMALERGAFHWASPTPLWHERQDGKRPDKSGGLAENLDACAVAVQALAIREDGKIDPETIVGTVRTLQPLLGYARIAARLLAGRGDVQLDDPLGDLVDRFGAALLAKLRKAADERGLHDHPWLKDDWHEDLVKQMYEHAHKGDPRDVAAYCAFAWHHGWSLKLRPDGFQDLVRAESLALSTYVAETFREGAVDEASVAELDLRVPLATTVLRLLKLAASRGAFAPGQHIQTEQGSMLLMQGEVIDAEFADFEEVEIAAKDICAGDRWIDAEGTRWHISDTWKTERGNWAANAREVKDDVFGPAARECIAEWKPEDLVTVEREPVREDTSPDTDPSPTGQARRALQRLGPTVAGVGGSIKLAAAIGIGPACGLSIDEFRPLLAAWNEAGTPRWNDEAIDVQLRDRYEQHKADFFADIPTTGPTSSEPEQDPAARLLPRPA